nr:unnamed protein product [Digitaria exilis]
MKATAPPAKRRRGPRLAVLALVFCSLLVPIAFLFNRFPAGESSALSQPRPEETPDSGNAGGGADRIGAVPRGSVPGSAVRFLIGSIVFCCAVYVTDERPQQEINLPSLNHARSESGDNHEAQMYIEVPYPSHHVFQVSSDKISGRIKDSSDGIHSDPSNTKPIELVLYAVLPPPKIEQPVLPPPKVEQPKPEVKPVQVQHRIVTFFSLNIYCFQDDGKPLRRPRVLNADEVEKAKACQLEFGSYCLWSIEHKEVMRDAIVKKLKDQLFVARSYYPSIAKLKGKEALTRELKQNIQEHERVLSESIVDADLPPFIKKKIERMDQSISKAKSCTVDCNNVDRKLRQILHMTEDEAHFHMKQSAYLYNLGVHTMPKTSVVINSTVSSCEDTENVVFHVLTDAQNFYAMKHWFARNSYRESFVDVINYEQFGKNDDEASLRAAALPISLLSFQHLLYPLDERLTLSGLGYDYDIKEEVAQSSTSLHYNGNMKPWLELGIPDYRKYWKRFLTRDERFMDECNVSP